MTWRFTIPIVHEVLKEASAITLDGVAKNFIGLHLV